MKTLILTNQINAKQTIVRVHDHEVDSYLTKGYAYCPKHLLKNKSNESIITNIKPRIKKKNSAKTRVDKKK